jgi:hypothetical protein
MFGVGCSMFDVFLLAAAFRAAPKPSRRRENLAFAQRAGTAQNSPMLATWRSFTWSSGFATGKELYGASRVRLKDFYAATGKALLRGLPRGETLRGQPREAKPFTRMAKWEIRFQRFAISFRPSALDVCCFRHQHFLPRRNRTCLGLPRPATWGRRPFTWENLAFAIGANEKFHLRFSRNRRAGSNRQRLQGEEMIYGTFI